MIAWRPAETVVLDALCGHAQHPKVSWLGKPRARPRRFPENRGRSDEGGVANMRSHLHETTRTTSSMGMKSIK